MADSGYFGMKLGDALSAGAGHISQALQRKYAAQAEAEERKKMMEEQDKQQSASRTFEMAKMGYENTPEALEQFIADRQKTRGLEQQKLQADVNKPMAGATPPPGYRFLPTGALEAIPGGPAAIKAGEAIEKEAEGKETQIDRIQRSKNEVDTALSRLGFWSTGLGAETLAGYGGTDARSLKANLDAIKANIGFDRLTQMRNESKTGGALGNVSDKELVLLTSSAGSLDQGMKKEDLKKNLEIIKGILDKAEMKLGRTSVAVPVNDPLGLYK